MFRKLTDVRKSYVSVLCAELDSQNEPNRRDSAERFVLDSGCTEHMVSEYVCLTDVRPITSSVRFGNNGVLKVAHIGELNTKHYSARCGNGSRIIQKFNDRRKAG